MCCNKPLTDPASVERGIGPICWGYMTEDRRQRRTERDGPSGRSDYTYRFDQCADSVLAAGEKPVLIIIDLDQGGMSVTNNIEAVLEQIAAKMNVSSYFLAHSGPIVYRDSDGNYGGVRIDGSGTVRFYPLATRRHVTSETEAIELARGAS